MRIFVRTLAILVLACSCGNSPATAQTKLLENPDIALSTSDTKVTDGEMIAPISHDILPKKISRTVELNMVAPSVPMGPPSPSKRNDGGCPTPFSRYLSDFMKDMIHSIEKECIKSSFQSKKPVTIEFWAFKSTSISGLRVVHSSGSAHVDEQAGQILRTVDPRVPLVHDCNSVQIEYTFNFKSHQNPKANHRETRP